MSDEHRTGRVEMELRDGRVIDLSGLTIPEVVARLDALGLAPDDVKETRHFITLPRDRSSDGKTRTAEVTESAGHERPRD